MEKDKSKKIVIVDYGMGNLRSVLNKFQKLNVNSLTSSKHDDIFNADKLILPGVGHFGNAMRILNDSGLKDVLNEKVIIQKTPILGICLGMQLFSKYSEEGNTAGLGWIDAKTKKFKTENPLKWKIPHIGWNSLIYNNDNYLYKDIDKESLFYFSHSYYLDYVKKEEILTMSNYIIDFVSSINKENIFGTQFHPEKSHDAGLRILNNFCKL